MGMRRPSPTSRMAVQSEKANHRPTERHLTFSRSATTARNALPNLADKIEALVSVVITSFGSGLQGLGSSETREDWGSTISLADSTGLGAPLQATSSGRRPVELGGLGSALSAMTIDTRMER